MILHDRLRLVRGAQTYRAFAARVRTNVNSVRRYELGLSRVPIEYVEAVCRESGVSADWLLFGVEAKREGLATNAEPTSGALAHRDNGDRNGGNTRRKSDDSRRYTLIGGEKVRIVCVPVLTHVPAGPPREVLDVTPVGFGLGGEVWVPDPDDENAYGLTARGDSMEPLIFDGETIIVSPRRRFDLRSGIGVVRIPGEEVCVKYVRARSSSLELVSANPRYPRMAFRQDEAEVLGAVVQVVRGGHGGN